MYENGFQFYKFLMKVENVMYATPQVLTQNELLKKKRDNKAAFYAYNNKMKGNSQCFANGD